MLKNDTANVTRLQSWIKKLELEVEKCLVSYGWESRCITCPSDLYEDIKEHFMLMGYRIWKERYESYDMKGYPTGEYDYHIYIGKSDI